MGKAMKVARVGGACVACGSCVGICPMGAIRIDAGVLARIDVEKCVGCGKCAKTCPADVITVSERGGAE